MKQHKLGHDRLQIMQNTTLFQNNYINSLDDNVIGKSIKFQPITNPQQVYKDEAQVQQHSKRILHFIYSFSFKTYFSK